MLIYGADVNKPGKYAITPLVVAAGAGNKISVELLLKYGADVNLRATDLNKSTALDFANRIHHYSIADILRKAKEDQY